MHIIRKLHAICEKFKTENIELFKRHGHKIVNYIEQLEHSDLSLQRITEIETKLYKYLLLGIDYKQKDWELEHDRLNTDTGKWEQIYHEKCCKTSAADKFKQEKQTLNNGVSDAIRIFGRVPVVSIKDKFMLFHNPKNITKKNVDKKVFDYGPNFIVQTNADDFNEATEISEQRSLCITLGVYKPSNPTVDCLFVSYNKVIRNYEDNRKYLVLIKEMVQKAITKSTQERVYYGKGVPDNNIVINKAYVLQQFSEKFITKKIKEKSFKDLELIIDQKLAKLDFEIQGLKNASEGSEEEAALRNEYLDTLYMEQMTCLEIKTKVIKEMAQKSHISIVFQLMDKLMPFQKLVEKTENEIENSPNPQKTAKNYEQILSAWYIVINLYTEILHTFSEHELKAPANSIVLSKNISNSMMKDLINQGKLSGILTSIGGAGSHVIIIARNTDIAAIVGIPNIDEVVDSGSNIIIDMRELKVIVNPAEETLGIYQKLKEKIEDSNEQMFNERKKEYKNKLGDPFMIKGSIENALQIESMKRSGSLKIGLVRTEHLYFHKVNPPAFDEHYDYYRRIGKHFGGSTIRTFDFSGDKGEVSFLGSVFRAGYDNNNFIRTAPGRDLLETQLSAFIHAVADGAALQIMYPLINNIEEYNYYNSILDDVIKNYLRIFPEKIDGIRRIMNIKRGAMLETHNIVKKEELKKIFKLADFFSIGTADLACFVLNIQDREHNYTLFDSISPKVLFYYDKIAKASIEFRKPVSVCGNLGGNPIAAFILYQLGLLDISVSSFDVPKIAYLFRRLGEKDPLLTEKLLKCKTSEEVIKTAKEYINTSKELSLLFKLFN